MRTDSTYLSLLELEREVTEMQSGKTKATDAELEREKAGAILGLPGRFQTASASLGQFRGLVYFGLPLDYYNSYVAKVDKVTAKQVTAAATKHLKPGQAVFLVVGDANAKMIHRVEGKDVPFQISGKDATLKDALADLLAKGTLGKGELVVLDADGQVKK